MATVTFPIELGGSGLVVSDDTDPTTGLRNGGYLTRFVPALQQTVAVAGFVVGQVSNAAASASAAAGSASAASSSASSAASSAASAATLYDQFDDRYLGPKASNPTVDNDGNALLVGAMYFNTSALETRVWNGTTWQTASVNGGTVNSLIVTGALQYQGTLTGGTGVINIGSGQIYKSAGGDVSLGTTTPTVTSSYTVLDIVGRATNNGGMLITRTSNSSGIGRFYASDTQVIIDDSGSTSDISIKTNGSNNILFGIANTERARFSLGGYIKASNTGSYIGNNASDFSNSNGHLFLSSQAAPVINGQSLSTNVSAHVFVADLPTAAAGQLFRGTSNNTTVVFQVLANGDVRNTNNSYGAISDPKLKDIIGPKSSTWEKTKQYNWIEYYLKSDTEHTFKMLGLNAEEAAAISPGVVDESPDLVEVTKVRQVPVQIVRLDENENPIVDEETGEVIYDEVMVDEDYTEWEPNGEFTKSVKYSVVSMQYHRTTQECQQRIESLEAAKVQADDLIQQIMARVAALESASA